jgi:hypothetical protein
VGLSLADGTQAITWTSRPEAESACAPRDEIGCLDSGPSQRRVTGSLNDTGASVALTLRRGSGVCAATLAIYHAQGGSLKVEHRADGEAFGRGPLIHNPVDMCITFQSNL